MTVQVIGYPPRASDATTRVVHHPVSVTSEKFPRIGRSPEHASDIPVNVSDNKYKDDQQVVDLGVQSTESRLHVELDNTHSLPIQVTSSKMAIDSDSKRSVEIIKVEDANVNAEASYLQRYPLLVNKTEDGLKALNKALSWETTVVPRPRTKRAALIAIANCVSSISHWFSPYFFLRSQEPRYQMGGGIIIAGCGLAIVFSLLAKLWAERKNKAIEREEERTGEVTTWRFAT
ncbi:hypothetical protein J3E73DRAFT_410328 [Bipolaris maydis]|nr:hypothetical protein J3E73DRAFT_410328 [Bipolaris maydis]